MEKTSEKSSEKTLDTAVAPVAAEAPEPNFQMLSNPARVLPQQVRERRGEKIGKGEGEDGEDGGKGQKRCSITLP